MPVKKKKEELQWIWLVLGLAVAVLGITLLEEGLTGGAVSKGTLGVPAEDDPGVNESAEESLPETAAVEEEEEVVVAEQGMVEEQEDEKGSLAPQVDKDAELGTQTDCGGGTACSCNDTLTSSWNMSGDLSCTGTALNIGAHDITLDCKGNKITHGGSSFSYGVKNTGVYNGLTVQNCRFETTASGDSSIWSLFSNGGLIQNNTFNRTVGAGAGAITIWQSDDYNLINNTFVLGLGQIGYYLRDGQGHQVSDSYIYMFENSSGGIVLNNLNSSIIHDNIIMGGDSSTNSKGIVLYSPATNNTFINNLISCNQSIEIDDQTGDGSTNYLIYNNSDGEIRWTDIANGGFLKNLTLNGSIGLGSNLFIGSNVAALNTSAFTAGKINSSANITLYGLGLGSVGQIKRVETYNTSSAEVLAEGTDCIGTSCEIISYGGGTLVFNTTKFSSFAAASSPSSCGHVNSDLTLTSDVSSPGTCFTINASNIVLDCAGYKINYSTAGVIGYGVNNTGFNNVTVKNCNLYDGGNASYSTGYGIFYETAENGTIEWNNITTYESLEEGIGISYSANSNRIQNNAINTSGWSAAGISVLSLHTRVENNTISTSGPGSPGLTLSTSNSTLVGNSINSSSANSIRVTGSFQANFNHTIGADNLVEGLPVIYNHSISNQILYSNTDLTGYGQIICGWCNNVTYDNVSVGSDGINLFRTANSTIKNSNIASSTGYGIYLFGNSDYANIENNLINVSTYRGYGIQFYNSLNSNITNNTVSTSGYDCDSIYLYTGSNSNRIINNTINNYGSDGTGIMLLGSNGQTIIANKIYTNAYSTGIYISSNNNNIAENNLTTGYPGIFLYSNADNNVLLNNNILSGTYNAISDISGTGYTNYLIYNNSFGEIRWTDSSTSGFLKDIDIDGEIGFGTNLFIGNNAAALNTSAFSTSKINSSANITIKGLSLPDITEIRRYEGYSTDSNFIRNNGADCNGTSCEIINYNNISGTLSFNTTNFSSFAAVSSPSTCGNISSNYTLNNDVNASGECFYINASNVVLDCAGYKIDYGLSSFGHGIVSALGVENITVKNCNLIPSPSAGIPIYLSGSNSLVFNNTMIQTGQIGGYGILLRDQESSRIENNTINLSGFSSEALAVKDSNNTEVIGNIVYTNGTLVDGIYTEDCNNITITNNTILGNSSGFEQNDGAGIYIYHTSNSSLYNNRINSSHGNSVLVNGDTTQADHYNHIIGTDNLAEGLPIIYNYSMQNKVFSNQDLSTVYGQIICAACDNITYNNITVGNDGFTFANSSNIFILNSRVDSDNGHNILMINPHSLVIANSTFNLTNINLMNLRSAFVGSVINISNSNFYSPGYSIFAGSYNSTVRDNNITGEYSFFGGGSLIENNHISDTLSMQNPSNSIFRNNTITASVTGIILFGGANQTIFLNNNITANWSFEDYTEDTTLNYLIYNNSYGEIRWTNDSAGGFLRNLSVQGSLGLGNNLFIGDNVAALNTSAFTAGKINSSANITLKGLGFSSVNEIKRVETYNTSSAEVLAGGTDCIGTSCEIISYGGGTLVFNTTKFSSFAAASASSCGYINSDTTLINDVSSAGTCFTINASDVVLDCAGYMINFSTGVTNTVRGVYSNGFNNVTIKNCLITDGNSASDSYHYAIWFEKGENLSVINNTLQVASYNPYGIVTSEDNHTQIINNTINSTGWYAGAIAPAYSREMQISGNRMQVTTDNYFADAVYLWNISNSNITDNTISANGPNASGISINDASGNNLFFNNNISASYFEIFDDTGDSYINHLAYNNSDGEIRWTDTANGGFLKNLTLNGSVGLGINLFLDSNLAALNTSAFTGRINSSANITLKGLGFGSVNKIFRLDSYNTSSAEVLAGGTDCIGTSCEIISYGGGTLVFNITKFSSFSAYSDNFPYWQNNQSSIPATYSPTTSSYFNITWIDDINISTAWFESNYSGTAQNYSMNLIAGNTTNGTYNYSASLPAGNHYWKSHANDSSNQLNSTFTWLFTINQAATQVNLSLNGAESNLSITYPQAVNATYSTNALTATIYRNGSNINSENNTPVILAAGNYNYTVINPGNQNYSASSKTFFLTVTQSTPTCNLIFDKTSPQTYGTAVNASCSCSNPETSATLYRNGINVTATENNQLAILSATAHNYICNSSATQNYTNASNSSSFTINQAASAVNLTINGNKANLTLIAGGSANLNCSRTAGEGSIYLYNNGTLINSGAGPLGNLTAFPSKGMYNITCQYQATQNYTTSSETYWVNATDSPPTVTLNSPATNYSANSAQTYNLNFNCSATDDVQLKNISLYITNSSNLAFSLNQTANISGTANSSSWNLSLGVGAYTWNCLAYDNNSQSAWAAANRTLSLSYTPPSGGGGGGEPPPPPPEPPPPSPLPPAPPPPELPSEGMDIDVNLVADKAAAEITTGTIGKTGSTLSVSLKNRGGRTITLDPPEIIEVKEVLLEEQKFVEKLKVKGLTETEIQEKIELELLKDQEQLIPIITRKHFSLGLLPASGITYTDEFVSGRMLKTEVLNPEEVTLNPGESLEKMLEIREGISAKPKSIRLIYKSAGEQVYEKEFLVRQQALMGTAIDIDRNKKLLEVYVIIPAEREYSEGTSEYAVELSINKKGQIEGNSQALPVKFSTARRLVNLLFGDRAEFSDVYGPYSIRHQDGFVFAQQLRYDPEIYNGDYVVKTKILQNEVVLVENDFELLLN